MNTLIEKIEALKISDIDMQKAITSEVYDEWDNRNKAINDVLDIIKAEVMEQTAMLKATALDKPNKVGRWIYYDDDILLNDKAIEYINAFSNEYKGKWIFIESEG
jgi:hypothetical protein